MANELILVGSIPLDTPEEVFETFGVALGRYLFAMPDGEVGPRRHWISRVHYQVLAAHPELEVVQRPAPDENGVERQHPRNAADAWWFKVKAGVKEVRFGDPGWRLGFARDAINSYFVFTVMKEHGILPQHLRFQVSIPMVNSVLPPRIFPNPDDLAKIRPGYEAATRAEVAKIVEKIPPHELAIQWDCSTEVQDAYGSVLGFPLAGAVERNLGEVRNLSPHIPDEVALGYHFCFGTLGGWPRFAPDDLGQAVKLANGFVAASGRRVDWVHLPVLEFIQLPKRQLPSLAWSVVVIVIAICADFGVWHRSQVRCHTRTARVFENGNYSGRQTRQEVGRQVRSPRRQCLGHARHR